MAREQGERTALKFDAEKSSKAGDALASLITRTIVNTRPQSIAEGLLIITLAVGRTIQILGTIMGCDPKVMCRDFCASLTKYFEMGGDERIDDIAAMRKQKGN